MFQPLKKLVIGLGILIVFLTIIVFYALYQRLNNNNDDNKLLLENNQLFLVGKNFKIISVDVEGNLIYFHLRSKDSEILRVRNLKNGELINDYFLKIDDN